VRSKADTSQLNLSTARKRQLESVKQKNEKVKPDMLRKKSSKSLGNHAVSPEEEKRKAAGED